jgi:hypothetical protein
VFSRVAQFVQPYRGSFGPYLLGMVAIGLAAYGVHMLIAARYRRMVLG